jgi:ribosome biogenesis GTPase A
MRDLSIQWYPGHMAQARRVLAKSFPAQDVIIEVLDARMPCASSNPMVTALRKAKPCIKLLNKADLADPDATRAWLRHFESGAPRDAAGSGIGRVAAIATSSERLAETRHKIPELCEQLVGRSGNPSRMIRAMVVGIPNVGKSTLINALVGRKVAKVGDEPAVTKVQQQVSLGDKILLSDNPGLLWPKLEDPSVGLKLALAGAISEAAIDYESVARFGAVLLLERYPALMRARFKLDEHSYTADELLTEIAQRRGCIRRGNAVDWHKAADVLIHDLRSGAIGRISLELPDDIRAKTDG